jgi:hypothetical protein
MGLIFPRDPHELQQAPKLANIPLVYVVSPHGRSTFVMLLHRYSTGDPSCRV